MALKIVAIFREFDFFRNKAKHAGRFRKNAGRKTKCGISRTIAGWLTPMLVICVDVASVLQSTSSWVMMLDHVC